VCDKYSHLVGYWMTKLCKGMQTLREQELRAIGLHRGQASILWQLRREEGVTQVDLAGRLDLTRASITSTLSRMEERGWIRRATDPQDRRVLRVHFTEAGKRLAEELASILRRIEDRLTSGLDEDQVTELLETLRDTHARLTNGLAP
jgi:DNA-binding MarR family transcriptional regulator